MSILIKGMEMPTLYRTYKVRFAESGDGKIIVGIASEGSTAYRPIGEVISVPPHGRLIDADALEADAEWDERNDGYISFSRIAIDCAPTIIPASEEGEG